MCNTVKNSGVKRANNALKRHLKTSAFVYAIFGSGTICLNNSNFTKTTLAFRVIQATMIMRPIQKYILMAVSSFAQSKNKFEDYLWFGLMLIHVMKMFAMFINGIQERRLMTSVINDSVKIDRNIQEIPVKIRRHSWIYSYKLYFMDMIGLSFLGVYHMIKYTRGDVTILVDTMFFLRTICILMHSSFCKFVYLTFSLFRNVNEQCVALKESGMSRARTTQAIRMLTVQHRSIVRVWSKLVQFYEPYLFFEVLSVFLDMLYITNKVYSYCSGEQGGASDLQVWHVCMGALWSFYEIISICTLCTKVTVEGDKTGIIMHEMAMKESFSYLRTEISYIFENMEHGSLACSPYGIFTINNRLFLVAILDLSLLVSFFFYISQYAS